MIFFLHGEDAFLIGRRKRALQQAFEKKYASAEFFVFDFEDQGSPENVRRALGTAEGGLFAAEKMITFLHPFSLSEGSEKVMIEFVKQQKKNNEDKTILLFVHAGKIKKTQPLVAAILKAADKEEIYDTLAGKDDAIFVKKELGKIAPDVVFSPSALSQFLLLTAGQSARMITEMEKLASYKGSGTIEREDIELLMQGPEESIIFNALDALGKGNKKAALILFHSEVNKSESVFPILSLCAWQVRRLLLVREAYDQGVRRVGDIASLVKLPPFVVQKMLQSVENFPLERIKKGLFLLSELDSDLKRGRKDPAVALDLFIWKF